MGTREALQKQREIAKRVENREGLVLAAASVGLGVGQLLMFRPLETRFPRNTATSIEGGVFLAYMALVGWLFWRMQRRIRAASPTCPRCGARLQGMSLRVAVATGRCDPCGGAVID